MFRFRGSYSRLPESTIIISLIVFCVYLGTTHVDKCYNGCVPYKDPQKRILWRKQYYAIHRDEAIKYTAEWKRKHRDIVNSQSSDIDKRRRREDPEYRERRRAYCRKNYQLHRLKRIIMAHKDHGTDKERARYDARNAIRRGELVKPDKCSLCHKHDIINAHHPDYSKPLEIIWVCSMCHGNIHKSLFPTVAI